jgi:hypothetical protein
MGAAQSIPPSEASFSVEVPTGVVTLDDAPSDDESVAEVPSLPEALDADTAGNAAAAEVSLDQVSADEVPPAAALTYAQALSLSVIPASHSVADSDAGSMEVEPAAEAPAPRASDIVFTMNGGVRLLRKEQQWSLHRTVRWDESKEEVYYQLNLDWGDEGFKHEQILIVEASCATFVHNIGSRTSEQVKLSSGDDSGIVTILTDREHDTTAFELRVVAQTGRLVFGSAEVGLLIETDLEELRKWCEPRVEAHPDPQPLPYEPTPDFPCENCGLLHYVAAITDGGPDEEEAASPAAPAPSPEGEMSVAQNTVSVDVYEILADEELYVRTVQWPTGQDSVAGTE